jgi:putative copper export protein
VALTCAGLLAMTGVLAAFVHLTKVGDLVTSAWGAQLVVKLVLVGGMVAGGAWNWRRATPRLVAGDPGSLRKGVVIELFFALAVLLATARLVLLSPPSA